MVFLKYLVITLVILWLFRKFGGFLFKRWVKNVTTRSGYEQFNDMRTGKKQATQKEEGEIYISKKTPPTDSKTDGIGDFVDFEEVE